MFLILGAVAAGNPTSNAGEITPVKLLEFLTGNSSGVFLFEVEDDSMCPDISSGDIVIVDSNRFPQFGQNIVAGINGEYTHKIYKNSDCGLRLIASNGNYQPRQITEKDDFEIVGVVTHTIKKI